MVFSSLIFSARILSDVNDGLRHDKKFNLPVGSFLFFSSLARALSLLMLNQRRTRNCACEPASQYLLTGRKSEGNEGAQARREAKKKTIVNYTHTHASPFSTESLFSSSQR